MIRPSGQALTMQVRKRCSAQMYFDLKDSHARLETGRARCAPPSTRSLSVGLNGSVAPRECELYSVDLSESSSHGGALPSS